MIILEVTEDKFGKLMKAAAEISKHSECLTSIFEEINRGLNQYTATVRSGTEELLGTYTSSMNEALRQLASSVEELGEVLEDLKDVNVAPHRRY